MYGDHLIGTAARLYDTSSDLIKEVLSHFRGVPMPLSGIATQSRNCHRIHISYIVLIREVPTSIITAAPYAVSLLSYFRTK